MIFNEAIRLIADVLSQINISINISHYDGLIVKKLEASNTLDAGRTTNQTHIAVTGAQMDIFPYLRAEGYFSANYGEQDNDLKKYFITQIPIWLSKTNIEYLDDDTNNVTVNFGNSYSKRVVTSIVRSRRRNQTDQIQMSIINMDSPEFVNFRKLLHTGDYLIVLKRKEKLEYEFYGVKPNRVIQGDGGLHELNNQFYKISTYTGVNVAEAQGEYSTNIERIQGGTNILLYGVPGSGKSYTIEHEYCNDESRMERLVFHPDYTYSDFVGQILPNVSEGIVSYKFTEGPFTHLLKKAYDNPGQEYYLIIEEINRGNAPAIFGEVFQLLDRDQDGTSEYGISNTDIARIVYGDENRKIRIPSNMSIIGTMNTSDQNVFTLDTAFQRRWNMRMIENDMSKVDPEFANQKILDTEVSWKQFNTAINNIILRKNVRVTSSEDKRLGAYFIRKNDLNYNHSEKNEELPKKERLKAARENSRFPEKVLKYLWDDAFKFAREDIFETSRYISLEEIVRKFRNSVGNERFSIFKEEVYNAIISDNMDDEEV